jgi:hypothetical protein
LRQKRSGVGGCSGVEHREHLEWFPSDTMFEHGAA